MGMVPDISRIGVKERMASRAGIREELGCGGTSWNAAARIKAV